MGQEGRGAEDPSSSIEIHELSQGNLIKSKYPTKYKMTKQEHQCTGPHCDNCVDIVGGSTSKDNAQHMARCAWRAIKWDTSGRFATVGRTG